MSAISGWLDTARKMMARIFKCETRIMASEIHLKKVDRMLAQMLANRSARAVVPGTFNSPIGDMFVAKITGTGSESHTYTGRLQYCIGYGTFEDDDVFTDEITISPLADADGNYPDLATDQYVFVRSMGRDATDEWWTAVSGVGDSGAGVVDNPDKINPTYSGTSADTDTWDKDSPPTGTQGVKLTITTRTAVDYANFRLLAFTRVLTFDDKGCLDSVSAETLNVVDTFNQCPED